MIVHIRMHSQGKERERSAKGSRRTHIGAALKYLLLAVVLVVVILAIFPQGFFADAAIVRRGEYYVLETNASLVRLESERRVRVFGRRRAGRSAGLRYNSFLVIYEDEINGRVAHRTRIRRVMYNQIRDALNEIHDEQKIHFYYTPHSFTFFYFSMPD